MNNEIERQNSESGSDRSSIYSWLSHAALIALTAASAICIVTVCVTYFLPVDSTSQSVPSARLVSSDKSVRNRIESEDSVRDREFVDTANRMDAQIRSRVKEKKESHLQRVPGIEVFDSMRERTIRELTEQLKDFTEYPEGSLQWHRLNRLQQLETNSNH